MRYSVRLGLISAYLVFIFVLSMPAGAVIQPLRVNPSRFIFNSEPGGQITGSITVTNNGSEVASVKAVISDWDLDAERQIVSHDVGTLPSSLGDWVKFNPRQFTLKPQSSQIVRFTIRVPKDVQGSEGRGLIAFEQIIDSNAEVTGVVTKVQIATTLYVDVAPIARSAGVVGGKVIQDPAGSGTQVLLDIKGTGTAHFRGSGMFKIYSDGAKTPSAEGQLPPIVVLPDTVSRFSGNVSPALKPGKYALVVTIDSEDPDAKPLLKTYEFTLN